MMHICVMTLVNSP